LPCHGSKYDLASRVFKGVPAPYPAGSAVSFHQRAVRFAALLHHITIDIGIRPPHHGLAPIKRQPR
jgi:hypothetical protein